MTIWSRVLFIQQNKGFGLVLIDNTILTFKTLIIILNLKYIIHTPTIVWCTEAQLRDFPASTRGHGYP